MVCLARFACLGREEEEGWRGQWKGGGVKGGGGREGGSERREWRWWKQAGAHAPSGSTLRGTGQVLSCVPEDSDCIAISAQGGSIITLTMDILNEWTKKKKPNQNKQTKRCKRICLDNRDLSCTHLPLRRLLRVTRRVGRPIIIDDFASVCTQCNTNKVLCLLHLKAQQEGTIR